MGKAASPGDGAIRSRLLNRLGIYKGSPIRATTVERKNAIRTIRRINPLSSHCKVIMEPLKDTVEGSSPGKRIIQFDSTVKVVCIPTRHEYSNRLKKCLWQDSEEIQENAERNIREFAAEGWDWHTVLENDDMFVDAVTGELVHPCWFAGEVDEEMETEEEEKHCLDVQGPSLKRAESFSVCLSELSE